MQCVDIIVPTEDMDSEVIATLGCAGEDVIVVWEKYRGAGSSFLREEYEVSDDVYVTAKDGVDFLKVLYLHVTGFFCVASRIYEKEDV